MKWGVPDVYVELANQIRHTFPLWVVESSFSQTVEAAYEKLRDCAAGCSSMVGCTLFDITEIGKHVAPTDGWAVEQGLNQGGAYNHNDWITNGGDVDTTVGGVKFLSHTWVGPFVVKVWMWVRPPHGPFDLAALDDSPNAYFSRAVSGGRVAR
jgi:hypothetical protein